jgi:hypothetical protein
LKIKKIVLGSPPHRWLRKVRAPEFLADKSSPPHGGELIFQSKNQDMLFLSHLCGGEHRNRRIFISLQFLSHLCGGEPAKNMNLQ